MKLFIDRDFFDNPKIPPIYLCNTSRKIIGELPVTDLQGDFKWNSYSEIQFVVNRTYADILTGETIINPLFDKIESPRSVYLQNIGFFTIQDVDTTYGDKDEIQVSAFSIEYTAGQKYLNLFKINKGEEDSKEVIYAADQYGTNTQTKDMYKLANVNLYDSNEKYFHRVYTDSRHYDYEQIQIVDQTAYLTHFGEDIHPADVLYIHGWAPVKFYDPNTPELSLLHLIFNELPEWKIGHVDYSLRHKERSFEEDRIAIYDFIMETVCDTFKCVCEWNTIKMEVNFYEEVEDGLNENGTVATKWDTDVYISKSNLASQINVSYSADDIKTKLKVSGADDLNIREVNLGKNYIMNLDYYHTLDWMEQDLFDKYNRYLEAVKEYTPQYTEAMQNWVGAYNKWNDLMNAVPAEGNVVLIGDEFKKLYCSYSNVTIPKKCYKITKEYTGEDKDFYAEHYISTFSMRYLYFVHLGILKHQMTDQFGNPFPETKEELSDGDIISVSYEDHGKTYWYIYTWKSQGDLFERTHTLPISVEPLDIFVLSKEAALKEKLKIYRINEDLGANVADNILLRLENSNSDVATIRIYNNGTKNKPNYQIQKIIVYAQSGMKGGATDYSIQDWLDGKLTAEFMGLKDYTVQYIGTMGAYFVLAKDERQEIVLEEYGVNLLKEKHKTYTTIFQAQTQEMFSQEKYQCVAQSTQPQGEFEGGTRWLDIDSDPMKLYQYSDSINDWEEISETNDDAAKNYENYQRYIDNYEKLQSVQSVLLKKEKQATYIQDGFVVPNRRININLYKPNPKFNNALYYDGQPLEHDLERAAITHFGDSVVTRWTGGDALNEKLPAYYFTVSSDPIIYGYNTEEFKKNVEYYIRQIEDSGIVTYQKVVIENQAQFDSYDGSTEDKTLYVVTSGHIYVVYLKDTIPYVAYADSQGLYQATKDWIAKETDFEIFFDEDQWIRLSPFIREDEFSDSNFLLTGYESEEERLEIYKELKDSANKELSALCQPSLEFSMEMANILALPEFKSLIDQFQLGNFVRVHIRDGYVKRARLLEVHLNFSDLSDFNCNFGNLVTTKSEIDKHADLLSQAVTAGKQVATSAGDWQRAVDKSNKLEKDIASGLQNASLEVGRASGQSIVWDEHGIWGRKLIDGTTDQYHPEQFRIINNKLVFSNDGFKTSKAVFGSYTINGETRWGPLAEYVTADTIEGKFLKGGSIQIGDEDKEGGSLFLVHEDGSVEIKSNGVEKYASRSAMETIDDAYRYRVELSYNNSTVFANTNDNCTITCTIYDNRLQKDVTSDFITKGAKFSWIRISSSDDTIWNQGHANQTTNTIKITRADVEKNAQFSCQISIDETQLPSDETQQS